MHCYRSDTFTTSSPVSSLATHLRLACIQRERGYVFTNVSSTSEDCCLAVYECSPAYKCWNPGVSTAVIAWQCLSASRVYLAHDVHKAHQQSCCMADSKLALHYMLSLGTNLYILQAGRSLTSMDSQLQLHSVLLMFVPEAHLCPGQKEKAMPLDVTKEKGGGGSNLCPALQLDQM